MIISWCPALATRGWTVRAACACAFSPHHPAVMELAVAKRSGTFSRLVVPRPLQVYLPMGPRLPTRRRIQWTGWETGERIAGMMKDEADTDAIQEVTSTWFAGAEVELLDVMGINDREADYYKGIGLPARVIEDAVEARYRDVPDEAGKVGHRLSWAAKGIHLIIILAETTNDEVKRNKIDVTLRAVSNRAVAMRRELIKVKYAEGDEEAEQILRRAFDLLVSMNKWVHRRPPAAARIQCGGGKDELDRARALEGGDRAGRRA